MLNDAIPTKAKTINNVLKAPWFIHFITYGNNGTLNQLALSASEKLVRVKGLWVRPIISIRNLLVAKNDREGEYPLGRLDQQGLKTFVYNNLRYLPKCNNALDLIGNASTTPCQI